MSEGGEMVNIVYHDEWSLVAMNRELDRGKTVSLSVSVARHGWNCADIARIFYNKRKYSAYMRDPVADHNNRIFVVNRAEEAAA